MLIAPAERADILVDFSNVPAGQKIVLENFAGVGGFTGTTETTAQIMQFTVTDQKGFAPKQLPQNLNPTLAGSFPTLPSPSTQRIITLIDVAGSNGPATMLLDGQKWDAPVSEIPALGSTEDWLLINPTVDAHPIHIHLIQFQVVQHQLFNATNYMAEWTRLNGDPPLNHSTVNVASLETYFIGTASGPSPTEQAWKDTITVNSGEIVTIRLRWTEQNGDPFPSTRLLVQATFGTATSWSTRITK